MIEEETNIRDALSLERKELQTQGLVPEWYTTPGYQLFKEKYEYETNGRSVRGQFERIAKTAASYLVGTVYERDAETAFFDLMWKGWLGLSSPVFSNMGTNRGMAVSCSGGIIEDSIDGFYTGRRETALLTKYGFGTSAYLGNIRARGTPISRGGKASGVVPVFKGFVQDMRDVAQGTSRRGAWAGYLPIEHGDFDELADFVSANPDDANVGWNISNNFIDKLNSGDIESIRRYQKALKLKMITGKGYFCFIDKVNQNRPQMYKDKDMSVSASNLCNEITLFSDISHTFTCVLSSANLLHWDDIKETDAIEWMTIFLDCVAQDFIAKAKGISGLENAVRFTEKGRALGLGVCGFHTYLQQKGIPFESFQAHMVNNEIFDTINKRSLDASKKMAIELGEPEWCKGYGLRNTHRIAIAPTKSNANLLGGVSEGISPDPAMSYTQLTAAGEVERINPILLKIMKERDVFNKKTVKELKLNHGSVQNVKWLSDEEKMVFRTAFEINQESVIRLASARAKYIDQWQSLNLFFSAAESEATISKVHQMAFNDPKILGLYYIYSSTTASGAIDSECLACS